MSSLNLSLPVAAHEQLAPDVRDVPWVSNCAGEIFLVGSTGVRIGHFQGDARLAAFVVDVHNAIVQGVAV